MTNCVWKLHVSLPPAPPYSGMLTMTQLRPQVSPNDCISLLPHAPTDHKSSHLKEQPDVFPATMSLFNLHFSRWVTGQIAFTRLSGLLSSVPGNLGGCPGQVYTFRLRGKQVYKDILYWNLLYQSPKTSSAMVSLQCGGKRGRERRQSRQDQVHEECCQAMMPPPSELSEDTAWQSCINPLQIYYFIGKCSHSSPDADHHPFHLRKGDGIGNKSFRQISCCHLLLDALTEISVEF